MPCKTVETREQGITLKTFWCILLHLRTRWVTVGIRKGGKKKNMKSKLIYQNNTSLVRISTGYKDLLKIKAAKSGMTIKTLLESYLAELLEVKGEDL